MCNLSASTLRKAAKQNPNGLFRLARWLRLRTDGYSARQTAELVAWRLRKLSARLSGRV